MPHLHLIREKDPEPLDLRTVRGKSVPVWCDSCGATVYVIHIDAPPIDPEKREAVP
jgi:hypothetical protein